MSESANETYTLCSTEVCKMAEKGHYDLLKDIRRYIEYLNEGNFPVVDFFAESTYTDSKGESRPCFEITRKGCELIAHKTTGSKGVRFTAAYITKFHEMEQAEPTTPIDPAGMTAITGFIKTMGRLMERRGDSAQRVIEMAILQCKRGGIALPVDIEKNPSSAIEQLSLPMVSVEG